LLEKAVRLAPKFACLPEKYKEKSCVSKAFLPLVGGRVAPCGLESKLAYALRKFGDKASRPMRVREQSEKGWPGLTLRASRPMRVRE